MRFIIFSFLLIGSILSFSGCGGSRIVPVAIPNDTGLGTGQERAILEKSIVKALKKTYPDIIIDSMTYDTSYNAYAVRYRIGKKSQDIIHYELRADKTFYFSNANLLPLVKDDFEKTIQEYKEFIPLFKSKISEIEKKQQEVIRKSKCIVTDTKELISKKALASINENGIEISSKNKKFDTFMAFNAYKEGTLNNDFKIECKIHTSVIGKYELSYVRLLPSKIEYPQGYANTTFLVPYTQFPEEVNFNIDRVIYPVIPEDYTLKDKNIEISLNNSVNVAPHSITIKNFNKDTITMHTLNLYFNNKISPNLLKNTVTVPPNGKITLEYTDLHRFLQPEMYKLSYVGKPEKATYGFYVAYNIKDEKLSITNIKDYTPEPL